MSLNKLVCISFFLFILNSGCAENSATGTRQLVLLDTQQEEDLGAREHPKVLKIFGGVYSSNELKGYVSELGNRLASVSEKPDLKWKFTVLDTPVVNAFALPGGYIYISRGLLALANDEAELASVIGHEIAHVTARHTAQRHAKETLSQVGVSILDLIVGQPIITNVASLGSHGVIAAFSRSEELEADQLGRRYTIKAGYDPLASSKFLSRLAALTKLSSDTNKDLLSSIFDTHPRTEDRINQAKNLNIDNEKQFLSNRKRYLAAIRNITYGKSSKNGIVKNNKFMHLHLDIAFSVPSTYMLENNKSSVIARKKNKEAVLIFDGIKSEPDLSLLDLVESNIGRSRTQLIEKLNIFERSAIIVQDRKLAYFEDKNYLRSVVLIRWDNSRIWRFNILTDQNSDNSNYKELINSVLNFHKLSKEEKIMALPRKINIHVANRGDTLSSLAERMSLEKNKIEWLKLINGFSYDMDVNDPIKPGTLIKIIVG